jgi:hypothetical protein
LFHQFLPQADQALRQHQRDDDEQQAEEEQPVFGEADGEPALGQIDHEGADDRPDQRAAPADGHPDGDFDGVAGLISDGLMMPTCGTYSAPAMPHSTAETTQMLVPERVVADEHDAVFGVADGGEHAAELRLDQPGGQVNASARAVRPNSTSRVWRGDVVAEDALEVGEAVVAAEAGLVAEEQQHRGVGQRLGDDREIHALDPRAEGEVAEHEGHQRRHRHDQKGGPAEMSLPTQNQGSSFQSRKTMKSGRSAP